VSDCALVDVARGRRQGHEVGYSTSRPTDARVAVAALFTTTSSDHPQPGRTRLRASISSFASL
jgi:hypothetical protein